MVLIPAGTFTMGSPSGELGRYDDEIQHAVTLTRSLRMQETEVTQRQWKALSGGVNPSYYTLCGEGCPVEQVDWYSALAYANALSASQGLQACYTLTGCSDPTNGWKDGEHAGCTGATFVGLGCTGYRLPTESEWEYAARAGTTAATYGGDLLALMGCVTLGGAGSIAPGTPLADLAWYSCDGSGPKAAAQKTPNAWGLYDMLGNVWEWAWDWRGSYPGAVTDPLGATTGSQRVHRGGSWNLFARIARAGNRGSDVPSARGGNLGFRLVRTASP